MSKTIFKAARKKRLRLQARGRNRISCTASSGMKRISQLDGVRGIAILLVLVDHYFCMQVAPGSKTLLAYCKAALAFTWSGVDLFFVLSGFLIVGGLLEQRGACNYFRIFYLRRVCRIFPLYFLILIPYLCLSATAISTSPSFDWLFHDPLPDWSYTLFVQNIFMSAHENFGPGWLVPTWSLAVEEQFYLFVPLIIYCVPARPLPWVLAAGIVTAPVLRCLSPGFHAFVNMPWRIDALLAGALLAWLVRRESFVTTVRNHRRVLFGLFLALLATTGLMTIRSLWFDGYNLCLLAALYSAFLLMAFLDTEPWLGRLLRLPALTWLGRISYGIYLFQQPVSGLLHGLVRHSAPQLHTWPDVFTTFMAAVITLLLAQLSYSFFEQPILKFAHRFPYSPNLGK